MRVLFLLHGMRGNSKRIYYDSIEDFMRLCDVTIYGPREKEINGGDISPIEFTQTTELNYVISELKPDILVLPGFAICNRFFEYCGIDRVNSIPKVILDDDFYAIEDPSWYEKNGIQLMIMLHPYDPKTLPIESVWLPPSVSESQFITEDTSERINRITFVGGGRYSSNKYYSVRQKAIRELEIEGLLDCHDEVGYEKYPKILQRYSAALSCSFPPLNFPPIKAFEIMASGAKLFITPFQYSDILFGKERSYYTYKCDCSDIIEMGYKILEDDDEVSKRAVEVIRKNHLLSHRSEELKNILTAVVEGSEVPRKWGI